MHHFAAVGARGWVALLLVLAVPLRGLAQNPDPSPSPSASVNTSGGVESQRLTLERTRYLAAKAEDTARVSMQVFAVSAGVCWVACVADKTPYAIVAQNACVIAGGLAIAHDVVQMLVVKKRAKQAWKEILTTDALVAVSGSAYLLLGGEVFTTVTTTTATGGSTASTKGLNSCFAAATLTAITIAKEIPIQSFKKAKNSAASELAAMAGGTQTQLGDGTLPSFGQGVRSAAIADVGRGGVPGATPPGQGGGGGGGPNESAATAGCSSFALSRDVGGTANCLRQQGEQIPKGFTSPEFADAFRKASGAELGQFLKAGAGEGNTAEGLLKKATANIEGINGSKFAAFADVVRSELSMYRGGGGGGGAPARRVAQDDDNATVARADSDPNVKFADPTPADTSLFGRATAQYKRLMKSKLFEMP